MGLNMALSSDIFEKTIDEVKFSDLQGLQSRKVVEGLFVEYKSDFTTPKKTAHSIASLANTHGGWYFVGVRSDSSNNPQNLDGFDLSTHKKPIEHMRNVIVSNIRPIPLFYSKMIKRPNNRAILLVYVPESYETPHITLDGRIYRRNAEGSDPVHENDRYTIDKLYEKGKKLDAMCARFFVNEFPLNRSQQHQGWLEIYLMIYPPGSLFVTKFTRQRYLENLKVFVNSPTKLFGKAISIGMNFDVVEGSENSVIFRQVVQKEFLRFLTLTFQIFRDGNAKIFIPLQIVAPEFLATKETGDFLLRSILNDDDYNRAVTFNESNYTFIDGTKMCTSFICLVGKYIEFLKKEKWRGDLLLHFKVRNCLRNIFWFDHPEYLGYVKTWGPPICLRKEFELPGRIERNYFKDRVPRTNRGFFPYFARILSSFGLLFEPAIETVSRSLAEYIKSHVTP